MPAKRCQHGDDAPRYAGGRCKICARERAAKRFDARKSTGEEAAYHREYRERRRDGICCPCGKNLLLLAPTVAGRRPQPSLYSSPECRAHYTYLTCVSLIRDGWRIDGEGNGYAEQGRDGRMQAR